LLSHCNDIVMQISYNSTFWHHSIQTKMLQQEKKKHIQRAIQRDTEIQIERKGRGKKTDENINQNCRVIIDGPSMPIPLKS
jgi:hypothetical protein